MEHCCRTRTCIQHKDHISFLVKDPVTAIGLAGVVLHLAETTKKIVQRLYEFQSSARSLPRSLEDYDKQLPVFSRALEKAAETLQTGMGDEADEATLRPLIETSKKKIKELDGELEKLMLNAGERHTKRFIKGIKSVARDDKIENIMNDLRGFLETLNTWNIQSALSLQSATNDRLTNLRQWLAAPEPAFNYHKALELRDLYQDPLSHQAESGSWFLKSTEYANWKASASCLWLHGIAGCGKTVLASTIIGDMIRSTKDDRKKAMAYFYFDFNDRQKQNADLMAQSLLIQLSQQCTSIPAGLNELFISHAQEQRPPARKDLLDVLRGVISEFQQTYVILDALDECDDRRKLTSTIEQFCGWRLPGFHLLLTSRKEQDLATPLEHLIHDSQIMSLEKDIVDKDIEAYVRQRLLTDPALQTWADDASIQQEIESALRNGAHGMFRWAVCQLDELGECFSEKMLRDALTSLPAGLDETYDRILHAIKPRHKEYAIRALRWLAFSQCPLTLHEITEAIAIDPERRPSFDRTEVLKKLEDILKICPSLIAIVDNDLRHVNKRAPGIRIVSLAHYFVKEYLLSQRVLRGEGAAFFMEGAFTHSYLAKCCLRYLLRFDHPNALYVYHHEDFQPAALADYCIHYWIEHVRAATTDEPSLGDAILELLNEDKNAYFNWLRRYGTDRAPSREGDLPFGKHLTPLYVASQFGLTGAVKRILSDRQSDVNANCGYFGTALQAAIYAQHTQVVDFLVAAGAICDKNTTEAMSAAGVARQQFLSFGLAQPASARTILESAAMQERCAAIAHTGERKLVHVRRAAVMQELLDRGAETDEQETEHDTTYEPVSQHSDGDIPPLEDANDQ